MPKSSSTNGHPSRCRAPATSATLAPSFMAVAASISKAIMAGGNDDFARHRPTKRMKCSSSSAVLVRFTENMLARFFHASGCPASHAMRSVSTRRSTMEPRPWSTAAFNIACGAAFGAPSALERSSTS